MYSALKGGSCFNCSSRREKKMFIAIPGETGFCAVRIDDAKSVTKTAQKPASNPAAQKPEITISGHSNFACSSKGNHFGFHKKRRR